VLSLAWGGPGDALITLGVAPLGMPSGSSNLRCQEELKARSRTISESSAVSVEDDSQHSSESATEDAAKEAAKAEAVKPGEDKVSTLERM